MTGRAGVVRVKLCGIARPVDARGAGASGADLIGTVLVPGTPRAVTPEEAGALREEAGLPLVVVVADLSARAGAAAARLAGADVIQLHGGEPPELLRELRREGSWELWKVVRPRSADEIVAGAERYEGVADALLLDRWHPRLLGGTGDAFDWAMLDELDGVRPNGPHLGLAGGLTPENVGEAIRRLRPRIVDVSSGVERAPREKDPVRMRAFVDAARTAAAALPEVGGRLSESPTESPMHPEDDR